MSVRSLLRTTVLAGAALGFAARATDTPGDAGPTPLMSAVLWGGEPGGRPRIALSRGGYLDTPATDTNLAATMAMIPVYRVERDVREVWRTGRLSGAGAGTEDGASTAGDRSITFSLRE